MRAFGRLAAAFALLFAAAGAASFATVIYVNAAATGANNGSSWADAYTTLPLALSAAAANDEIWVAQATYKPTATPDRTLSLVLKNGVSVYGGFVGNETQRAQRAQGLDRPGLRAATRHRHRLHRRSGQCLRRCLDRGPVRAGDHRGMPDQSAALLSQ